MTLRVMMPGMTKFLGVARALARRGLELVLYNNQISPVLQAEDISVETFESYLNAQNNPTVLAEARSCMEKWQVLFQDFEISSLPGLTDTSSIARTLAQSFLRQFPTEIVIIEAMRQLQETHPISLLMVHEDVTCPSKSMVLAARELGIPTLHVSHGSRPVLRNIHDRVYADVIAVHGQKAAQWYIDNGNNPDKIVSIGSPFWDDYFREMFPREEMCRQLHLDSRLPVVTYATTWINALSLVNDPATAERAFRTVLEAVRDIRQRQEIQLVVKLHPSDPVFGRTEQWYTAVGEMAGVRIDAVLSSNLKETLAVSDAVVCVESTTGVEAMLLKKPVVTIRVGKIAGVNFFEDDPALIAHDGGELSSLLEKALFSMETRVRLRESRKKNMAGLSADLEGHSTEKLALLVSSLAGEGVVTEKARRQVETSDTVAIAKAREDQSEYRLSVIIAGRNDAVSLEQGLSRLVEKFPESFPYEVIYVDDASEDKTGELLGELEGDIRVLLHRQPQGSGLALLEGAAFAMGEKIVFFMADSLEAASSAFTLDHLESNADPEILTLGNNRRGGLVVNRRLFERTSRWVCHSLKEKEFENDLGGLITAFQKTIA